MRFKIISIGDSNYNNRIKALSVFKKQYNSFGENIDFLEAKELYDIIIDSKTKNNYFRLRDISHFLFSAIDEIFDDIDYEHLGEDGTIMDLGSSKYQMIEVEELKVESEEWYETLTDREKEYISYFQSKFVATAH